MTVFIRPEPTLLRGRTVLIFTVVYAAVASIFLGWSGVDVPPRVLIATIVALAASALMAPFWFVLGGPRTAVDTVIEVCFGRICAKYERSDTGFVMMVPGGGGLHVGVHALPSSRLTVLSLRARPSPMHKKGDLFRRLLGKQYRGVLPTIRIRM